MLLRFARTVNFLTPKLTNDGKPYGPIRFKQLVQECYLISKNINTSYNDVVQMTPTERQYILSFLAEEAHKVQQQLDENKRLAQQKNKKR